MHSKATGTKAGREFQGRPPTFERPIPRRRPELEPQRQPDSRRSAQETGHRQPGTTPAEQLFQAVHGVGSVNIDDVPAALPDSPDRVEQILFRGETGQNASSGSWAALRYCFRAGPVVSVQNPFDLGHGDHRQEAAEEQEAGEEQAEAAEQAWPARSRSARNRSNWTAGNRAPAR